MESVRDAVAGGAPPEPIDLQHLARYTLGHGDLGREVLALFREQAPLYVGRLRRAGSLPQWKEAAHSLKGSAQAIGAFRVAEAAQRAEDLAEIGEDKARVALEEIQVSVAEATAYIGSLL